MLDSIVISDIHLGADICKAKELISFLEVIEGGQLEAKSLILNGDVFDSQDFRRLHKTHWKILSKIRKLSKHIDIIWISGNHDGPADIVSHLLGVSVTDEYLLLSGNERIIVQHGDRYDTFITNRPILTWIGDTIYNLLQKIDKSHQWARWAKHSSKHFLRCVEQIKEQAVEYALKSGASAILCGHSHYPCVQISNGICYANSGSWTEIPCSYLTVDNGEIQLKFFQG